MKAYPKIQTVYLRDPDDNYRTLLEGQWAKPEFEYLRNNDWLFTEKVDGTNIRVHWDGERVTFGGRTDNAQIPAFLVNRLQELFAPELFAAQYPDHQNMTLYGEGHGAKIQKAGKHYIPDDVDFILFDVLVGDWWLARDDVEDVARTLEIKTVPAIGYGTLTAMVQLASIGFNSHIAAEIMTAEGIVARPILDLLDRGGNRIITKVKYKDFAH